MKTLVYENIDSDRQQKKKKQKKYSCSAWESSLIKAAFIYNEMHQMKAADALNKIHAT